MRELEYPFDSKRIMRRRKAIRRELLENETKRIKKKIAVLGGSTTNDVVDILELFLLNYGIEPEFYQSEYGRFWEEAVFDNPSLDVFHPDIIYVHTTNKNITEYPVAGEDAKTVDAMREDQFGRFRAVWKSLTEKYHCPIIQNNFELPYTRVTGNRDAYVCWGGINYITKLNVLFYEYASSHENIYINDINYQAADIGLEKWFDPFSWYMYKYAVSLDAIPMLAFNVANIVKSIFGKNKKAMAIDLDNTLWGGIIGDDGVEGISLGNETSRGQIYTAFQQYLKKLQETGILLNIISKNDKENAENGLKHPGMVLKRDDFISIKANWEPKSENLIHMAEELSLGADSFVFVDDNPAEREIIRQQVPGVGIPELDKAEDYIRAIDKAGYFEMTSFSADDINRNEMYRENVRRSSFQNGFADYSEYLRSLEMTAEIKPFAPVYMDRIAQLTNKSNQFNLTTKRCSREEIEKMALDEGFITLYGKLEDKFGDNGVVTVVAGQKDGRELKLILWLMSCRVLKRDMETAMMDALADRCASCGINKLRGYYYPTEKNGMVRNFYEEQGFEKVSEDSEGNTEWLLDLNGYEHRNHVINVKEN